MPKIKIDSVSLYNFDFIPKKNVLVQEFNYGSIVGNAEMIGFQILLFKKKGDNKNSCLSIDCEENMNSKMFDFSKQILSYLKFKISLGDTFSKIESIYGKPFITDDIFENCTMYYFLSEKKNTMHSYGISPSKGVTKIEIVQDADIIKNRIDHLIEFET